jgi:hypothetical protein
MSCNTESWAKGTVESAVDMLAKRAAVARLLRVKKADMGETLSNGLSALQRQVELNPALAFTLGGAALGAGAGGLSSLAADPERRHTGRSMMTGALAGGAVGGGGYMASRMIPPVDPKFLPKTDATSFTAPGGTRSINTEAIKANPSVIAEIEKLRSKSLPTQAVTGSWDFMKNYASNHPILASILAGDIASNTVGTTAGYFSGLPGMHGNVFQKGLAKTVGDAKDGLNKGWVDSLTPENLKDILLRAREAGSKGEVELSPASGTPGNKGFRDAVKRPVSWINEAYNRGTPGETGLRSGGIMQGIQDIVDKFRTGGDPSVSAGSPSTMGPGGGPGSDGISGAARDGIGHRLLRTMEQRPGSTSWAGKLGPRAALYLGIPALQGYAGTLSQESANQKRLQQLIEQLSTPGPSQA